MTPNTTSSDTPADTGPAVFTVHEVAEKLRISNWMVNKLIREHTLRSIQIGARRLVPTADLDDYVSSLRTHAKDLHYGN